MDSKKNKKNNLEQVELDNFSFDGEIEVEIKPENVSINFSSAKESKDEKNSSQDSLESSNLSDELIDVSDDLYGKDKRNNANENSNESLPDDIEDISDNKENFNDEPENLNSREDNPKNLKDKINDTKNKINDTKDKIKNTPENIKNKYNDAKDKVNNAKEKAKQVPDSLRQKKDAAKQKWDNKPRSMNEAKLRAKNVGSNLKDKAKASGKSLKDKAKQGIKNKATEKFNESKVGKAVNTVKKLADPKTIKKTKWILIALGVLLGVCLITLLIVTIWFSIFPGKFNVNSEEESYSEKDIKYLQKLRSLHEKYPNSDAALAMVTVIYPFYDTLQSDTVKYYINSSGNILDPNENYEDSEDEDVSEDSDDKEDCVDEECETEVGDDIYLEYFRKYRYRRKYKYLLKHLNGKSIDESKEFLKDKYFKDNKEYKELFALVDNDKKGEFADAILDDLLELKESFTSYIYENRVCSSSTNSLGYSDGSDLIKGEAYVVLKDTTATKFEDIKNAKTSYNTDDYNNGNGLDLKRYTMGVAYCEVGSYIEDEDFAKTAMIAAKSFVLARSSNSKASMGYKTLQDGNKTIFYMRNNTYDQCFCDVYDGCLSGSKYAHDLIENDPTGEITKNVKGALSEGEISNLSKWYDETASEFIYDDKSKGYYSAYLASSYNDYCTKGNCLLQNKAYKDAKNGSGYLAILKSYYSDSRYVIKNIETEELMQVSNACSEVSSKSCSISDEEFIYYSQRSYKQAFCGRNDGSTISSSGCGVTSMAMVLANLVDDSFDPIKTMNEAKEGGYCGSNISGTSSEYFSSASKKYGLNYESLAASDTSSNADSKIINTLSSGGLIIANVGAGWSTVTSGHYLVIKGITADNKLIIADPMTNSLNNPFKNNITISEMRKYMSGRKFHLFTGGKSDEIKNKYCKSLQSGTLSSPFGLKDTRDFSNMGNAKCFPNYCSSSPHGYGAPHGAIDLAISSGTEIYAMDSGKVINVGDYAYNCLGQSICSKNGYGIYVTIDHGNGYKSVYAHLSERKVNVDDVVDKGSLIGLSGNTGNSTGPHLHLELQNTALLNKNGRQTAKQTLGKGLMNPANYINKNISYVGKSE